MHPQFTSAPEACCDSFVWHPESSPVEVSIGPAVLRELYARLATERSGVPREFGGVLLGTVESTEPLRTRVDRFEPFPLKAQDGTTYTLSSADQQRLGRFSERLSGRAAAVVGFFRSHERRGLYLDQRDFELFRLYFQHPGSVFLLLRAETDRLARGGIFVWEDGDMRRDSSYEEFLIAPPPETAVARRPAAAYDARERLRPAATALIAREVC